MGKCGSEGIPISFIRPSGKFLARVVGPIKGNVHLRRAQLEKFNQKEICLELSKNVIASKLSNSRCLLARGVRDHGQKINKEEVTNVIEKLTLNIEKVFDSKEVDSIRGIEGKSAEEYFGVFNNMITQNKDNFFFTTRTKRPPLDRVNAMLSYLYTIINLEVQAALEAVGLDPYIGFMHVDRAGRASLAADLTEELRAYFVDRMVLSLINLRQVKTEDFLEKEGGAILMSENCRKTILQAWQARKRDVITHDVINEKIQVGLIPYVQAQLIAKHIRGEISEYPAFIWR